MKTLAIFFFCVMCQLGFGGAETNGPAAAKGMLVPLPLKLPAPVFLSVILDGDYLDPHLEKRPDVVRPPFLAPVGVTNLAFHKPVRVSDKTVEPEELQKITDGNKEAVNEGIVHLTTGKQWVQIDLGSTCTLYAVVVWHDHRKIPIVKCVVVQTSDDEHFEKNVRTWFNNDYGNLLGLGEGKDKLYIDTNEGRLIDVKGTKARYIRCYSKGTSNESTNPYTEIEAWGFAGK